MPSLFQLAALATAIAAPAVAGWAFFGAALGDGDDAGDGTAQALFTAVFALSAGLLEMLVFQVAGFLDDGLRAAAWKADVAGLLLMLGVAVPFVALYRTLAARGSSGEGGAASAPEGGPPPSLTAALALGVGGAALWRLGAAWPGVPQLAAAAKAAGAGPPSTMAGAVARAGAAGAAVVGVLSGYGAVALPRAHLAAFVVPVSARDVAAADAQLVRTVELAARKRKAAALAARRHAAGRAGGGGVRGGGAPRSGLSRFLPFGGGGGGGGSDAAAAVALTTEASALDALARELAADALDRRREADRARGARTLGGRARNALGYALSAYCALRVCASLRDLVRGPPPPGAAADPAARLLGGALARALSALLPAGVPPPSAADASHYVAVALVGAVGVGSLNGFLRACRRALAAASGSRSTAAPSAAALALCEVLGLYALSTLLLTARRLPDAHRAAVAAALGGDLDAAPYLTWFNGMLLVGVGCTALGLAAARALKDLDGVGAA